MSKGREVIKVEQEVVLEEALDGPVERAQARADTVRSLLTATWLVLADAWEAKDHETLSYGSWSEYMTGEYGDLRLNLCADDRAEAVMWLLGAGMTQGQVGETLGVSQSTVSRAANVKRLTMHMHNAPDGAEDDVTLTFDPALAPCQQGAEEEATDPEQDTRTQRIAALNRGMETVIDGLKQIRQVSYTRTVDREVERTLVFVIEELTMELETVRMLK